MNTRRCHQYAAMLILLFALAGVWAPSMTNAQQATSASEGVIVNQIEELVGIWESQHGASGAKAYRQYEADGTIWEAYSYDNLRASPLHKGHVWFENNVYYQKNEHPLAPDSPGRYEVRIHKAEGVPDRLSFRVIDDVDKYRIKDFAAGMIRIEPGEIATRIEDIAGLWKTYFRGIDAYMQYDKDGTFRLAYSRENLQSSPLATGKIWFEEKSFYIKDQSPIAPYTGEYEVQVHKEDDVPVHLSFHVIEDREKTRVKDLTSGMMRSEP